MEQDNSVLSELERLAKQKIQEELDEVTPDILEMGRELLADARIADEGTGRFIRYPFELFVSKWYIPFRAMVTFGVDTVQLGSALEKGLDRNKRTKSCLFHDWKTICISPYNRVSLYDLKTNKHVIFTPPMVMQHNNENLLRLTETNLTNNLASSAERTAAGREVEGKYIANQSVVSAGNYINFKETQSTLVTSWKNTLDDIDKFVGRDTNAMINYIASILPKEIMNPEIVKKFSSVAPTTTTTKKDKQNMLDAFE